MRLIIGEINNSDKTHYDGEITKGKSLDLDLTRETKRIKVSLVYDNRKPVVVFLIE